jgi:hypothetical protein
MADFPIRWLAVERYESIDDTIVQLFASRTSGQIAGGFREKVEADFMDFQEQSCISTYAAEMENAEHELFAFIGAVTQLFGPEAANLSAEDWLDESELMDSPPRSTTRDWRAVTVAASARLANRLAVLQRRGSDCRVGARIRRFFTEGFAARRAG